MFPQKHPAGADHLLCFTNRTKAFWESNSPSNPSVGLDVCVDLETDNLLCNSFLPSFKASDELRLSLGSITKQAPDDGAGAILDNYTLLNHLSPLHTSHQPHRSTVAVETIHTSENARKTIQRVCVCEWEAVAVCCLWLTVGVWYSWLLTDLAHCAERQEGARCKDRGVLCHVVPSKPRERNETWDRAEPLDHVKPRQMNAVCLLV